MLYRHWFIIPDIIYGSTFNHFGPNFKDLTNYLTLILIGTTNTLKLLESCFKSNLLSIHFHGNYAQCLNFNLIDKIVFFLVRCWNIFFSFGFLGGSACRNEHTPPPAIKSPSLIHTYSTYKYHVVSCWFKPNTELGTLCNFFTLAGTIRQR